MKKMLGVLLVAIIFSFGCSSMTTDKTGGGGVQPAVEVQGPVKMDKKATTIISGKGFKPSQELVVLFTAKDGVPSDVGYALTPPPKPDASGAWSSTWKCGRFIAKKMVKAGGSYEVTVTDSDFNAIAQTSVMFIK